MGASGRVLRRLYEEARQKRNKLFCIASLAHVGPFQSQATRDGLNSRVTWIGLVVVVDADKNVEQRLVVPLTSLLIMTSTISKGTLNLRFMQNAQRAEQELETNPADAEPIIKDESHWEVSREVKEMWGITSEPSSSSSSSLVTHETSYLPFVLSCINTSGSSPQPVKLRGRRTWNKRGQEVTGVEVPADDDSRGSLSSSTVRQDSAGHHHQPASKRLPSISSFGPGSSMKETTTTKRTKPRNAKSAQEIIREAPLTRPSEISEIGIELEGGDTPTPPARAFQSPRSPPVPAPSPNEIDKINNNTIPSLPLPNPRKNHPPTPPKFLKPAGVDEPPSDSVAHRDGSHPAQQREADIINHGTQRRQNLKRHRDDRRGASSGGGDGGVGGALTSDRDRKRKKSGAAAAAAAAAPP